MLEQDQVTVVASIVVVSTIILFSTGIPVCWRIIRKGSSSDVSFFPFVIMFCSATLWFKYGLLKHDPTILYVNSTGAALTLCYTIIYYIYTSNKVLLHKQLAFGSALLFPILLYLRYYAQDRDDALFTMGMFTSSVSVLSYGSPLSAVSEVIKTRSTSTMTFSLSLGNFIVAMEWVLYGYLVQDLFIQVPNFMGLVLSLFQLCLFIKYPSKSSTSVIPKQQTTMHQI